MNVPGVQATRRVALVPLVPLSINTTPFVASIFGSGEARRGSIPRSGAVTEEQRSQNRKATQPSGRPFFLAQTSLLAPYRPRKGMRVARASSGPKIPGRKRGRINEMGYQGNSSERNELFHAGRILPKESVDAILIRGGCPPTPRSWRQLPSETKMNWFLPVESRSRGCHPRPERSRRLPGFAEPQPQRPPV